VGTNALSDIYDAKLATWDLALKFRLRSGTNFFLNGKNLTNQPTVQYQGDRGNPTAVVYYGAQFNFGVRQEF
jgi:hypothetical protein